MIQWQFRQHEQYIWHLHELLSTRCFHIPGVTSCQYISPTWSMRLQMAIQRRLHCERPLAQLAVIRLLSGVNPDMSHQIARLLETLRAIDALVRELSVLCYERRLLFHDTDATLLCCRLYEDYFRDGHRLVRDGLAQLLRLLLADLDDGGATPLHLLLRPVLRFWQHDVLLLLTVKQFYLMLIEFESNSRRFDFSARSLGHVMFLVAGT